MPDLTPSQVEQVGAGGVDTAEGPCTSSEVAAIRVNMIAAFEVATAWLRHVGGVGRGVI